MSGKVSFRVETEIVNANVLPELQGRLANLQPAFENIINDWAKNNRLKFSRGAGRGAQGAEIDPTVFWEALTPQYLKRKLREGYGDSLMVRTGALEEAMTDPNGFFRLTDSARAIFGMPNDPDDAIKVTGNWPNAQKQKRQVIFLSLEDQRMIQMHITRYLSMGPDYQQIMFAKGVEAQARRKEVAQMDVDFSNTVP